MIFSNGNKRCSTCNLEKKAEGNFWRDITKADGFKARCISCCQGHSPKVSTEPPLTVGAPTSNYTTIPLSPPAEKAASRIFKLRDRASERRSEDQALQAHLWRELVSDLRGTIEPAGYSLRRGQARTSRSVCLLLTDLHLGATQSGRDNPWGYGPREAARRLEHIVIQALEYKTQYRDHSELVLLIGGDIIEGALGHDISDGAALLDQIRFAWRVLRKSLSLFAQHFPRVRVFCQSGNHGRNKLRHPLRATSEKWDGFEGILYHGLAEMCSDLPNVSFDIPDKPISFVDLYGKTLALTHGDTEIRLSHPVRGAAQNAAELAKINATLRYGRVIDVLAFGHFHSPANIPGIPTTILSNGALLPPNGYARSQGFGYEPTCQLLWEAVEGFPVGDIRWLYVGREQDQDDRLGALLAG
jgi:hypothetical protein